MATYREIVYMVLDELHQFSDDSRFTEEHIIFLAGRYRSVLLKQRYYTDLKKQIPESNYQTICLDLEKTEAIDGFPCEGGYYLRTKQTIPTTLPFGTAKLYPVGNYYQGEITFVTKDRMKYVGHNSWMNNIIYASLEPSNRIYLTSNNPQFLYLEGAKMTALFEDAEKASELECENSGDDKCDILDRDFPLEDSLISPMLELIVKELNPSITAPEDKENNADDNLMASAK